MLKTVRHALMTPVTGPIATAAALALAVALGAAEAGWQAQAARYETRIAELNRAAELAQSSLRTQLAACHGAGSSARTTTAANLPQGGATPGARRLLEQQPAGIDACARMESADRAVLSNLKR
jgi:hypothetical protein